MIHAQRPFAILFDFVAATRRLAGPLLAVLAPVAGFVVLSSLLSMRINLGEPSVGWAPPTSSLSSPASSEELGDAHPTEAAAAALDGLLSHP